MPRPPSAPADIRDFTVRKEALEHDDVKRYGEDMLLPTGHPNHDLLDFALEPLVLLTRYASQIEARAQMMLDFTEGMPKGSVAVAKELRDWARELQNFVGRYSYDGIALRRQLKAAGLFLGLTKAAA